MPSTELNMNVIGKGSLTWCAHAIHVAIMTGTTLNLGTIGGLHNTPINVNPDYPPPHGEGWG